MAKITTYFAKGSITPQDRGATAFEQAGRRLSTYYEQIARGDTQLARDIGDLWNEAKFNAQAASEEERLDKQRGGGGVNFRVVTPRQAAGARGGGGGARGNYGERDYNAPAARGISEGAASVGALTQKLVNGQGLTDSQYQQLGLTAAGRTALFNLRNQGSTSVIYGKNGVQPNPEPTDKDAAAAGFNMDQNATPGTPVWTGVPTAETDVYNQDVPSYPWSPQQFGPPIMARDKNGVVTGSNVPGGSPLDPNSPNYVGGGGGVWQGIVNTVGTLGGMWPMGDQTPAAASESNITDTSDNAME